jgi:hypothetical protein
VDDLVDTGVALELHEAVRVLAGILGHVAGDDIERTGRVDDLDRWAEGSDRPCGRRRQADEQGRHEHRHESMSHRYLASSAPRPARQTAPTTRPSLTHQDAGKLAHRPV